MDKTTRARRATLPQKLDSGVYPVYELERKLEEVPLEEGFNVVSDPQVLPMSI